MELFELAVNLLDASVRTATPLILAALAGLFAERSGVIDIGLEGKMLGAAFFGATVAAITGSAWLGLGAGIVSSTLLSLLHGFACITHRGNQVISGLAINILVAGLAPTLGIAWFARGGQTPTLQNDARFQSLTLPFADAVADVPILGPIYSDLLSGHNILVYAAFVAVAATAWIVYRTRFGLRLRAVGENPAAVDTAGISVTAMRYKAILVNGLLTGVAGTYLSVAQNASFVRDMTAGQGYLALAALIFAKWRPVPVMFTCLLFGFLGSLEARLQGVPLPVVGEVPVQFIQALPYILTVVLLAGFIGKAVAPKAIGVPYVKER
ncbi:MAG TPA: ABC transporter permease [Alphaproteobacteria bacterium]|nr:ABC transporter permease [Alphaproteobacteria bacterium]